MKNTFSEWFVNRFMYGVTFFHIAGLAMLLLGADFGKAGEVGGQYFKFTATLAQVAGFIAFFYDLAKARFKREPIVVMQQEQKKE
jgi:hypothetical protein